MGCELWPYDTSCLPTGWAHNATDLTPAHRSSYDFAVEILNNLTLRQFGRCEITVRPCSISCAVSSGFAIAGGGWFTPMIHGGQVFNVCGCARASGCGCGETAATLRLDGRVDEIAQVRVDGGVLAPTAYRVDGDLLVRTDGGIWPLRQNLTAAPTGPGTFEVRYWRGTPLPAGGRRALATLMVEVHKGRCGDNSCRLPARVTNVVREGVTYSMLDDPTALLNAGRFGITDIDMWLSSVNPHNNRARMAVYSPDLPRRRVSS